MALSTFAGVSQRHHIVQCLAEIQIFIRFIQVADVGRLAVTKRVFSERKGPRYFVAKLTNVAIYSLFERLSYSFKESHLAFIELSTKVILFLKSFQINSPQQESRFSRFF